MAEQFRVSLHHPVLVFVWGLSLLLIGCFIGTHWHPSRIATRLGARAVAPLYGWVDPETHFPEPPQESTAPH